MFGLTLHHLYDHLESEIEELQKENRRLTQILTGLLEKSDLVAIEELHFGRRRTHKVMVLLNKEELEQKLKYKTTESRDKLIRNRINFIEGE